MFPCAACHGISPRPHSIVYQAVLIVLFSFKQKVAHIHEVAAGGVPLCRHLEKSVQGRRRQEGCPLWLLTFTWIPAKACY